MKPLTILGVLVVAYWIGRAGYELGKHDADRYYAEHPVTLIQPIKLRAPDPVASIEETK